MSDVKFRTKCCLCDSMNIRRGLSLMSTPPANEFVSSPCHQDIYPLDLYQCISCGHIQLGAIVNPELLFRNYVYVSGTSPVFVAHFDKYASDVSSRFNLKYYDLIVEIGSNDGTLLNSFAKIGHERLVGFEPAVDIAIKAQNNKSFITIPEFFDDGSIDYYRREFSGKKAKLVVANNVFAHSNDLQRITSNIFRLLDDDGVFIFEVSYFLDVLDKCLFDTIYHEHISYHTVHPLVQFFNRHGMNLFDVEKIDTHGGSIRCYVDKYGRPINQSVFQLIDQEISRGLVSTYPSFYQKDPLGELRSKIDEKKHSFRSKLDSIKSSKKIIGGYGAPAKATTLMYEFGLDKDDIQFIVDDSPWKQGLFTPGKHIPVVPRSALNNINPDCLIILAWNFADSIIEKNQSFMDNGGLFIDPMKTNE